MQKFTVFIALISCQLFASHGPLDLPRCKKELEWVAGQNEKSRKFLSTKPEIQKLIKDRSQELIPQNLPLKINEGDQEFYISAGSLKLVQGGTEKTVIDVSKLPKGAGVSDYRLSPDKRKIAYGYAISGADWQTWMVIDLESLQELTGPFYIKNSSLDVMNWGLDSKGLYYPNSVYAYKDANGIRDVKIKYHQLGTDSNKDKVVFVSPERFQSSRFSAVDMNENFFIVHRVLGVAEVPMAIYLVDKKTGKYREVISSYKNWGRYMGFEGEDIYVRTSSVGDRYGVIAVNTKTFKERVVVPESKSDVLLQAQLIRNKILLQYLDQELNNIIRIYYVDGTLEKEISPRDFGMPKKGSLSLFSGNKNSKTSYFSYSSVEAPAETFKFDLQSLLIEKLPSKKIAFDGSKIKQETRYYKAEDGTLIPIQIFSRTDVTSDPEFAYLYIYGNIGIANLSQFNRKFQLMLEMGGIVALAGVRGGGEYGLQWQKVGTLDRKKTVSDIAYASRFLKENYKIKENRVALSGRSYGGMMTMASFVYYQDDFSVFTPVVPVSNNYDFLQKPGWWAYDDFGFKRNNEGIVLDLVSYYRLFRWNPANGASFVKTVKPIMSFSQINDNRVSPEQNVKFIKKLQDRFGEQEPLYLIEYESGGHNSRSEIVDEATFIAIVFGIEKLNPLK